MSVLSTSKNAPADGSGIGGGCSTSAAAAEAALAQPEPRAGQDPAKRGDLVAGASNQPTGTRHQRGSARHDSPVMQHPHTGTHATWLTGRAWSAQTCDTAG